ncbi:MAG: DUF4268 domain-containing protein [Candidatus Poribacteria bacterium]|nr:DUF4268 domain-containing protein [Candidatus Poribacteria bacterium]
MCQNLKQLTSVDLNEVWENEPQHFTPWLAQKENLTLLGETLGIDLELETQEINIGDFRADLLCKNRGDGSWVLIENQLAPTDHTHAGQLLTYAAGLDASTVIWIAKRFRSEHRAMLDSLNRITDERYCFFGIEVKVWQIEDSARAVQFEVVSSPNDWSRGVNRDIRRAANQELSETDKSHLRFWTGLREYMQDKASRLNCPAPGPWRYIVFSIGRTGFTLETHLAPTRNEISIRLCIDYDNAKAHFYLLQKQQEAIEKAFGEPLEWHELPGNNRSRISLTKVDTDPLDENEWPHQYEWFTTQLEVFDTVFRERIRGLDAADWIPEEDDP